MADFFVAPATWELEADELHALRHRIFVEEQQVPEDEEWDGLDATADHVIARNVDGEPIGCARLVPPGRIGRMAVLPDWRGRGVGSAMLMLLLERVRERGGGEAVLHAQASALEFYARHGFEPVGTRFMEAGIEHQAMRRDVLAHAPAPRERGRPAPAPEPERLRCEGSEAIATAVLGLLGQARHRADILCPFVKPLLPDDEATEAALRRIATAGRNSAIRILIHDADQLLRSGHRLIGLVQRLESSITIRVVTEAADRDYASAFLLNDAGGYLLQMHVDAMRANGSSHEPGRARALGNLFAEMWQRSIPATALRRLDL